MVSESTLCLLSCWFQNPILKFTKGKQLYLSEGDFAGLLADELLLPHMKRVDGMITDNRKRLLHKLHIGQVLKVCFCSEIGVLLICITSEYLSFFLSSLQTALDNFPEISVVTELKRDGESPAFKVRLSGKAYNKKTMKPYKMPNKVPQVI